MKLVACLITHRPAEQIAALLASLKAAGVTDYVIGVDAKAPEGTLETLASLPNTTVFPFSLEDETGVEHWAKARNKTLERLPEGTDWHLWIDSDDTLHGFGGEGEPPSIPDYLATIPRDVNAVFCDYQYHFDAYGNCDTLQSRHRILSGRVKWFWQNRIHEDVHIEGGKPLEANIWDGLVWVHHVDEGERDPQRNFRVLAQAIKDEPDNLFYKYNLGNQHFAAHHWQEAIDAYASYKGKSNRVDEKWSACIYMGIAYQMLDDLEPALACFQEALTVQPKWAEAYFGMGEVNARMGRWEQAIQWGEIGIERTKSPLGDGITEKSNFINANAYSFAPYVWLGQAYFNVGDNNTALECYRQAAKQRPEPEILYKIKHIESAMERMRGIDAGLSLAAQLMRTNEPLKARNVLANLPAGAADQKALVNAARQVVEKRLWHLRDDTEYRNFYFAEQTESIDPLEDLPYVKEKYPRMDWVLQRLKAAGVKKVLDLGVGNAISSFYYAQHGIKVVGVDVDWRRVKAGNFNAVKLGYLKAYRPPNLNGHRKKEPRVIQMDPDAQVQFHCAPADVLSQQIIDLGPYDAVVAAEIIEHVEHPEKILDAAQKVAKRVILSTPDASYDGPQAVNVGHVRGWSQRELVPLLADRGRIVELHTIPHPNPVEQPTLAAEYVTDEKMGGLPVIIWCFNTGQEWTPESIHKGGIGGSETAVIKAAEELVKRGCRVTVYAECEGVWNGVRYARTENFNPQPCWLFISWRSVGPSVEMKGLAEHRFIWSHDMEFGEATAEQLEGVTVVALSEWHKKYLMNKYATAEVIVSGNGIDPERFAKDVERIPHRLIYAQSPDRGLDVLLRLFPQVRQRYPDATLEVFYGFDLLDRTGKRDFRRNIEEAARQPGVTLHGRVDQDRLAEEYLKADALVYPGVQPNGKPFYETYGISIVEAQAAGCVPITPDWGALLEVNQYGTVLTDNDFLTTQPSDLVFLSSLFHLWSGEGTALNTEPDREAMMRWARQQTWGKVIDNWVTTLAKKPEAVQIAS